VKIKYLLLPQIKQAIAMRLLTVVTIIFWQITAFGQFTDSNLPIVVINTAGGVAIPDSPKVPATMGIIYNGEGVRNYLTDPFNEYYGNIGIEVRGSSSQGFPKKQYGLETRDGFGNAQDVSVFNMAFDNDWVLFAPYSDKSLMRNALAYEMGWQTGQYAPRTQFCEVVLNGSYDGVYIFTEKIKRKDGKVGTDDVDPNDNTFNQISGDYIFKVDKTTSGGVVAWTSPFPHYTGASTYTRFQLHDPDLDSLSTAQFNYLKDYVTDFETALMGSNFTDPVLGYEPWINVESFADFMLVNEVSKNVDGYRISTFLHKLRLSEGGKLWAGPLWDFNLAFGNADYCQGGWTTGWEIYFYQVCSGGSLQNPPWWERLVQDPDFAHLLNCRYQELRLGAWHTDTLMNRIDEIATYLDESQQRNFQRWPILGTYVWPNNFVGITYYQEVGYLKSWLTDRLTWMDNNMFGSCNDLGIADEDKFVASLIPNPAKETVQISFNDEMKDGTLYLSENTGKIVKKVIDINTKNIQIDLNDLESGIYFYTVRNGSGESSSGKLSIIK
jgi:hypothetical protein